MTCFDALGSKSVKRELKFVGIEILLLLCNFIFSIFIRMTNILCEIFNFFCLLSTYMRTKLRTIVSTT